MALHFEGERTFALPAEPLWEKLRDTRFLARCIPDVEEVTEASQDQLTCRLRPGFSFVRGTLDLTLRIIEAVPGQSLGFELRTRGIGTTSAVQAAMKFSAAEAGSSMRWTVDVVELGGLLKAVPSGLIRAAAQKVIADAWEKVASQVGGNS